MKRAALSLLLVVFSVGSAHAVDLNVVAKERFGQPARERPFADLIGFSLRESSLAKAPYATSTCPGATNSKGEVRCKIECDASSPRSIRLYVHGPKPEVSPSLKGYVDPNPQIVDIERCVVKGAQPIVVVYRTPEIYYRESFSMFPEVFQAAGFTESAWSGHSSKLQVASFSRVAGNLEGLALKDERNIEGIQRLSTLALVYQRLPPDQKNALAAEELSHYRFGGASIALRAKAIGVSGGAGNTILVSPKPEDYYRSVGALEEQLKSRSVLSEPQLRLYEVIREYRKNAPQDGLIQIETAGSK